MDPHLRMSDTVMADAIQNPTRCVFNTSSILELLMSRCRFLAVVFFVCTAFAIPAAAQEVGVRAGVSVDPNQFYFGGHAETAPLIENLHFRPNLEVGVGNDTTLVAFNIEFAYHFPSQHQWHVYAGGGPALNFIHAGGETASEGGLNLLVGVQHARGLFAEFKVGMLDSPNVKLGVGYAFRWR
jgi:hypothetical protein